MRRIVMIALAGLLAGALPTSARAAAAPSEDVVKQILGILKQKGLVSENDYQRLTSEYAKSEAQQKSWLPKLHFFGDLRLRGEGFWYNKDALGVSTTNRYRARYRLRFGAAAQINDHVEAVLRLASGGDRRSSNQTLGAGAQGGFFDPDPLYIDWAYLKITPFKSAQLPLPNATLTIEGGKVPNPYKWKVGKDLMLWDDDVVLEGAQVAVTSSPNENLHLFGNTGYYWLQENAAHKDPNMTAVQFGATGTLAPEWDAGARVSGFFFGSINTPGSLGTTQTFDSLAMGSGNILGGLANTGGMVNVAELSSYVRWNHFDDWPVTLYGSVSRNFSAESVAGSHGRQDMAWGGGIETGKADRWVKLGLVYYHLEANAFPAFLVDSDFFQGDTNRRGLALYASRQLWKNTDLNVTLYKENSIKSGPLFATSASKADLLLLQTDIQVKF